MSYGVRTPGMLLYKDEFKEWKKRDDVDVHVTIDQDGPVFTRTQVKSLPLEY